MGRLWQRFFGGDPHAAAARALYRRIVAQARRPELYTGMGVPDTLDGRFDLVALHAFLVLRRLKGRSGGAAGLAQALVDTLILDMDHSLRELGAGDLGVGRRVKAMAQGFLGRIAAYEAGLESPDPVLQDALRRNLYGTVEVAPAMLTVAAAYVRREASSLEEQDIAGLLAGSVAFGPPPSSNPVGGDGR